MACIVKHADPQINSVQEVFNPNSIRSYKIVQKLSPKHAARGIAQSPYPTYRRGKACLSKQPPWRAAGDPRLARGRSRVRAPGPAGTLRALFFSTLPSFFLREIVFFCTFPTKPVKPVVRLGLISLQRKVEADFLCSCNLAGVQIYSTDKYTEGLKL